MAWTFCLFWRSLVFEYAYAARERIGRDPTLYANLARTPVLDLGQVPTAASKTSLLGAYIFDGDKEHPPAGINQRSAIPKTYEARNFPTKQH